MALHIFIRFNTKMHNQHKKKVVQLKLKSNTGCINFNFLREAKIGQKHAYAMPSFFCSLVCLVVAGWLFVDFAGLGEWLLRASG